MWVFGQRRPLLTAVIVCGRIIAKNIPAVAFIVRKKDDIVSSTFNE